MVEDLSFHLTRPAGLFGVGGDFSSARYFFFGVPYDLTSTFRDGSRYGPEYVRRFSANIEVNSIRKRYDATTAKLYDAGDIVYTPSLSRMLRHTYQVVKLVVKGGKIPIMVGGEHTFTLAASYAVLKQPAAIVIMDAHFDLRDEYAGLKLSHATYLRRLLEKRPDMKALIIGVRGYDLGEKEFAYERGVGFVEVTGAGDVSRVSRLIKEVCRGRDVYISVDIDVLDPAYAPGVGNPEPEGLSPTELFDIIHMFHGYNVCGFDVMEVNPMFDNGSTSALAAKTICEMLAALEES